MTSAHPDQLTQTFRRHPTGETLEIPVQTPATNQPFVLWSDIQCGFKGAGFIQQGHRLVPYMKDDNMELIKPLRIAYHPGVELEIVSRAPSQVNSMETAPGFNEGSFTNGTVIARTDDATVIKQIVEEYQGKLKEAMAKNIALEDQLLRIQIQQQKASEEFARDRKKMMDIQREALESLISIHCRVQTVLTKTYELHEYQVPRLFIVLPRPEDGLGGRPNLISRHFRLYFLCEYGTYMTPEGSKPQHKIHLAKHQGYDLDKPDEFFERYGSYIITMLQMVQYGIVSAGAIVQPVANKVVDGLSAMSYPKNDINPLISNVIRYLQDSQQVSGADLAKRQTDPDRLEPPSGADLRQMKSYLKIKDGEHSLGNLSRIVTQEGDPKWVCVDCLERHRGGYRDSAIRQLRGIVETNGGQYIAETSRIEIKLKSSMQAREFYETLTRAGGIQELDVTLTWDATMDDFRALTKAVSEAKVIDLTVDGTYLKGSWNTILRNKRLNPIFQLAHNGRIQYLKLQGFEALFDRVNQLPSGSYPTLREFSMESGSLLSRKAVKSFNRFLEHRPPLTTLTLRLKEKYSLEKTTTAILSRISTLQSLTIEYGEFTVTTNIMEDKTKDVELTINCINDLVSSELAFIKEDHLTRLSIKHTIEVSDEDQLEEVLRNRSRLMHLRIGSSVSRAPTIIELVISTREKIYQEGGVNGLRTFELTDGELIPFDEYDDCDTTTQIRAHVSFRDDQSLFDMRTRIRVENGTDLTDNHSMYDFIRQFGWSIVCMEDWTQQSGLASNFDDISSTRGLSLETLSLSVSKFTTSDYERLESIIQRLPNFKQLGIRIERAAVDQSEIAHSIIERYGSLLFKLHLCRIPSMEWLVNFASLFPSRAMFPNLISFEVSFDSDRVVLGDCVRWIASMVSSPSPTDGSLSAKALSQNDVEQDTSERPGIYTCRDS
ncbi:hypothetical protein B0O80DRAFT_210230 [Mortierella sp. GBAus27b]|nr:hypothetical protein B0O80DRAFT_210230 [Mortierella sp. GBAus27b]